MTMTRLAASRAKFHFVGHDQHRCAIAGEGFHDRQDLPDQLGIEGRGGFIEEHHLGFHGEGAGNGNALASARRKFYWEIHSS